ncbi:uncharacterized protein LOC130138628 [Syzygium oleosum]|uniref:uncharacterized protein LOC130138628 n=1 Tax=Syzygium oleosum TaxID=219896 RepID=UPI0024B96BE1|nr:uncharacterized protein LOC130138628 [Syzygium oleosum]
MSGSLSLVFLVNLKVIRLAQFIHSRSLMPLFSKEADTSTDRRMEGQFVDFWIAFIPFIYCRRWRSLEEQLVLMTRNKKFSTLEELGGEHVLYFLLRKMWHLALELKSCVASQQLLFVRYILFLLSEMLLSNN